MQRSTKNKIKKEVVEVKVDEDRQDYVRYLGEDMAGILPPTSVIQATLAAS